MPNTDSSENDPQAPLDLREYSTEWLLTYLGEALACGSYIRRYAAERRRVGGPPSSSGMGWLVLYMRTLIEAERSIRNLTGSHR